MAEDFSKRLGNLKGARNRLLSFHKVLIDRERREIERVSGNVTPGQFLNMLMNDSQFEWLRTISRLVVRIDEAFELDDGISFELVESFETEISAMFDRTEAHEEFKRSVASRVDTLPEAKKLKTEIRNLVK